MTIISSDELKQKLGRDLEDTDNHQEKISLSVTNTDGIIKHVTGTLFESTAYTDEYVDYYSMSENKFAISNNLNTLWCPGPIISITSIYEGTTLLVENTDYYVYKSTGRIDASGSWSSDRRGVKLNITLGYSSVPAEIKECALLIAQTLTGLAVSTYLDENREIDTIIKHSVPAWVWRFLKSKKWVTYV